MSKGLSLEQFREALETDATLEQDHLRDLIAQQNIKIIELESALSFFDRAIPKLQELLEYEFGEEHPLPIIVDDIEYDIVFTKGEKLFRPYVHGGVK